MQMKRLVLALAAVASMSVVAAPANAQFGSGSYGGYAGPSAYAGVGYSPYPPHYGPYVGPFGGDATYGGYDRGYVDRNDWRSRHDRDWRRSYYRRDGYSSY
jgi:hypothetical protein